MTNVLAIVTLFFLIVIIYLINKIQVDRQKHQSKIKILEDFIAQISFEHQTQNHKLQLSEDLKKKVDHFNSVLSKDIYDLNFKLVEELYPRK